MFLRSEASRTARQFPDFPLEQDHRSIKLRLGPMLGFKKFRRAATTIAGIELMHRIRKGQFKLGKLRVKNKTASEIWNAVLAA
jgi:transposase-like protein